MGTFKITLEVEGRSSEEMAQVLHVSPRKIDRIKRRFVEDGCGVALNGQRGHRSYEKIIDERFGVCNVFMANEPLAGRRMT